MKKIICLLSVVMCLLLGACGGEAQEKQQSGENVLDAEGYAKALKEAGCTIGDVTVYTEETDPNEKLGRPKQYTSKCDFYDTTLEDEGGTIEVFKNKGDCQDRYDYLKSFDDPSIGALGLNQYMYKGDKVILRVSYDITPTDAKVYEDAFNELEN